MHLQNPINLRQMSGI